MKKAGSLGAGERSDGHAPLARSTLFTVFHKDRSFTPGEKFNFLSQPLALMNVPNMHYARLTGFPRSEPHVKEGINDFQRRH